LAKKALENGTPVVGEKPFTYSVRKGRNGGGPQGKIFEALLGPPFVTGAGGKSRN